MAAKMNSTGKATLSPLGVQALSPKMPFSEKQLDFIQNSDARVNLCEGSVRSGKTIVTSWRWFFYISDAELGGALVMAGRTRDSVWRNVIQPMQDPAIFGELAHHVVGNYGSATVKILGRTVHVLGGHDVASELVLRGLTVRACLLDEATTVHVNFFKQMLARMSLPNAQMFATTNPDNPQHWLLTDYVNRIGVGKKPLRNWKTWKFLLEDNPGLSRAYIRAIKQEYSGSKLWYDRYINGLWVVADEAVFDFWDEEKFVVQPEDMPPMQKLYGAGLDYGTAHPTVCIVLGLGEDDLLYLTTEYRYESDPANGKGRLNDDLLAVDIKKFLAAPLLPAKNKRGEILERGQKPEWIFIDHAAASLRQMMEDRGFDNVVSADKSVLDGIRVMSSLLTSGKLKISASCKGLLKEIPGYSWSAKEALKGNDVPDKDAGNDDSIDAARYAIATSESEWRWDIGWVTD